jgi:hypothetical protein
MIPQPHRTVKVFGFAYDITSLLRGVEVTGGVDESPIPARRELWDTGRDAILNRVPARNPALMLCGGDRTGRRCVPAHVSLAGAL